MEEHEARPMRPMQPDVKPYTVQFRHPDGRNWFYATVIAQSEQEAVNIVAAAYPWGVEVQPAQRS